MKNFLRVLSYAQNLAPKLTQFFIYSVLGVIFGVFNILLVIPMLSILFDTTKKLVVPVMPEFSFSSSYVKDAFYHYFLQIVNDHGKLNALLFVCALIVASVLTANLFRYLERVMAT